MIGFQKAYIVKIIGFQKIIPGLLLAKKYSVVSELLN